MGMWVWDTRVPPVACGDHTIRLTTATLRASCCVRMRMRMRMPACVRAYHLCVMCVSLLGESDYASSLVRQVTMPCQLISASLISVIVACAIHTHLLRMPIAMRCVLVARHLASDLCASCVLSRLARLRSSCVTRLACCVLLRVRSSHFVRKWGVRCRTCFVTSLSQTSACGAFASQVVSFVSLNKRCDRLRCFVYHSVCVAMCVCIRHLSCVASCRRSPANFSSYPAHRGQLQPKKLSPTFLT